MFCKFTYRLKKVLPLSVTYKLRRNIMLYCYEDRGRMSLIKPNPNKFELVQYYTRHRPAIDASGNISGRTIYATVMY